jgi:hypothetical protein
MEYNHAWRTPRRRPSTMVNRGSRKFGGRWLLEDVWVQRGDSDDDRDAEGRVGDERDHGAAVWLAGEFMSILT